MFKIVKKIDKIKDGDFRKLSRVEYNDGTIDWYHDWEQNKPVDKENKFTGIGKLEVDYYEEQYQNSIKRAETSDTTIRRGDLVEGRANHGFIEGKKKIVGIVLQILNDSIQIERAEFILGKSRTVWFKASIVVKFKNIEVEMNKKEIKSRHEQAEKELKFTSSYLAQVEMLSKIRKDINQRILHLKELIDWTAQIKSDLTAPNREVRIKNAKNSRAYSELQLNQLKRDYKLYQRGLEFLLNNVNLKSKNRRHGGLKFKIARPIPSTST